MTGEIGILNVDAGDTLPGWGEATEVDRIARKCRNPECRHVWNEAPLSAGPAS